MEGLGQLFSKETQAIFYNWKEKPVQVGRQFVNVQQPHTARESTKLTQIDVPVTSQRMLDFDFLCGKCCRVCETIACAVPPSPAGPGLLHSSSCSTTASPCGPAGQ